MDTNLTMLFRLADVRATARSALCVVLTSCITFLGSLCGQLRDSPPQSAGPGAEQAAGETVASVSSYRLEWKRHFQLWTEPGPVGTSDESGTLWIITHAGAGRPEDVVTKIDPSGQLIGTYYPKLPLKLSESVVYLSLAASGNSIGLLASLASGAHDDVFEGAFFVPVRVDGLGTPRRVAGRGPQFPTLIGAGSDQFIAAGDQYPLTLLKLDTTGSLLWRRSFSRNLDLPTVSVGANGNIFVVSEGNSYILVQMLDRSGRVLRSKRIPARQGTVAADPNGGCSILFSIDVGGKDNKVYLLTLDNQLQQLSQVETPLRGLTGRTYQLVSSHRGHLIIGDGPERHPQFIAEFDRSGKLIWQQTISAVFIPLLVPFPSGFYFVRDVSEGMDIEKYLY